MINTVIQNVQHWSLQFDCPAVIWYKNSKGDTVSSSGIQNASSSKGRFSMQDLFSWNRHCFYMPHPYNAEFGILHIKKTVTKDCIYKVL